MDSQIKKGVLDACVLYVLSHGESYGYKIVNDLEGIVDVSESTLYPILRRLETGGALQTYTNQHNGRLRKYYKLTPTGINKLNESKNDFKEIYNIYLKIFGGNK